MDELLNERLERLKRHLTDEPPSLLLIDCAELLIETYPRSDLPDWVEILANGNPDFLGSVVEIALDDMKVFPDEVQDAS